MGVLFFLEEIKGRGGADTKSRRYPHRSGESSLAATQERESDLGELGGGEKPFFWGENLAAG